MTYPFNCCATEVGERIINSTPQFAGHVITYPCWDLIHVGKRGGGGGGGGGGGSDCNGKLI